ncbi:hypothetical protein [Bradyrhizobium sp. CCBAU 53421]|uniref:hypothetical protein n=1 Tax=Bradyrhizobium sp. CCBAU 53421 TaxID=1325120 RepID=UPI00188D8452|nr:hypothetical protein [Bradyrhizobium sp. CCBAU 53421]QOZ34282.1 hypothetical protein XH92_23615 [Bradyrhizobium sp. CCBAU 53421]
MGRSDAELVPASQSLLSSDKLEHKIACHLYIPVRVIVISPVGGHGASQQDFDLGPPALCRTRRHGDRSLRDIAAELEAAGHVAKDGKRYTATAISRMIAA